MTTARTVSETLDLAADLIKKHGWVQGSIGWHSWFDGGGLCLEGGIAAALNHNFDNDFDHKVFEACPAYLSVQTYLQEHEGWFSACVYDYNDAAGRTAEQVIAVLKGAAAAERAKEAAVVTEAEKITDLIAQGRTSANESFARSLERAKAEEVCELGARSFETFVSVVG